MPELVPQDGVGRSAIGYASPTAPSRPPFPPESPWHAPGAERAWDVRGTVLRHWRLIAATTIVVVVTAGLVTTRLPRSYEATASIRIDERRRTLPPLDAMRGVGEGSDVSAELAEIRSRSLGEAVVDSLALRVTLAGPASVSGSDVLRDVRAGRGSAKVGYLGRRLDDRSFLLTDLASGDSVAVARAGSVVRLGDMSFVIDGGADTPSKFQIVVRPFADAVDELRKQLRVVRPTREASVVTVTYRGRDPALVRDVPNVLATQFIERRLATQQGETRSTARFLRDQIQKLAGQLASAEDELRSFRERARIVDIDEQGRSEIGNFAQVQAQRNAADAERASLAKTLDDARGAADRQERNGAAPGAPSPYRNLVAFPTLFRNQAAAQLLASLAAAEERRSELLTRRTPEDPDVQQLSGRVREIEEQLRSLTTSYLSGLVNEVGALDATLSSSRRQLARFPAQEVRLARLERRARGLEEISTLLQTRLKEAEIAQSAGDGSVRLMDAAVLPRRPSSPKPALNVGLALVTGLALGLGLALAREATDGSVRSRSQLHKLTGTAVLGFIPHVAPPNRRALAAGTPDAGRVLGGNASDALRVDQATWAATAAFQRLVTNVAFSRPEGAMKMLMLASPLPGEGKTTVSINMAITLARAGRRVLLVDADLRRAMIHTLLGIPRSPGLAELLQEEVNPSRTYRQIDVGGAGALFVLPAGAPPADPSSVFALEPIRRVLRHLGGQFDVVLFDTSPINVVADGALLASLVDAVILLARAGVTTPGDLAFAMEQLRHVGAPVIGTVLNDIDIERDATYDGAYRYYGNHTAYSTPSTV